MLTEEHFIPFAASNLTGKKVMVLAPHPDDETLGCGGSLALHAAAGDPVKVIFLTNGAKGDVSGQHNRDTYIGLRRQEALAACACLGVMDVVFWLYEDRELCDAEAATSELITVISEFNPDLIYAPSPQEHHPDHRAAAMFILAALKNRDKNAELFFYEVNQPIRVSHLVDITPVLDKKIQALRCYRSQLEERPYDDVALALSRFRSMTLPVEVTHAEGFLLSVADDTSGSMCQEATPWSGKVADQSINQYSSYALAIIVRTQGIRQSLLSDTLGSIACQSLPCLAVVVVHGDSGLMAPVAAVCRAVDGLSYVLIHAAQTERKRGYPANVGIHYCLRHNIRFKALAFLDDDDIFYPELSQKMDQAMRDTGADIIYAASNRRVPGQEAEEGYRPVSVLNLFLNNFIPINSYIVRMELLAKTPVFFDESLDVFEDWHFLLKLLENGFRFEAIADTLCEFRIISDGNKQVKDHPEIWNEAQNRIYAYIHNSLFRMNGRMLQSLLNEENIRKSIQDTEVIRLREELHKNNIEMEALRTNLETKNRKTIKLYRKLLFWET